MKFVRGSIMHSILLSISLMLISATVLSSEFTAKQKAIIHNEAIRVLEQYQSLSNQLADNVFDPKELAKTSQSLIDLFVSRKAIVFNDLDPTYNLSEVYELETYVSNLLLWYPDGMKIDLDYNTLRAGDIIAHGNDIYSVDLLISKKINGNYLNKQQNTNTEQLLFRVAFYLTNRSFQNYKIAGIRSSKSNLQSNDTKLLTEVKSVDLTPKDMQLVMDQSRYIINDYLNFLSLITDPKEDEEDKIYYRMSFLELFTDSTLHIANDIEPDAKRRWIPVYEYKQNLSHFYPEGVRNIGMNVDSIEFGKVIPEGKRYGISIYADKFFAGRFKGETIHRDNSRYDFRISFERYENTFRDFKIASIDKLGVNLYEESASSEAKELPSIPVTTLKRGGLYFGIAMAAGATQLVDENLQSNPLLSWSVNGKSAFNIHGVITYYLNNRIGISSGISYNRYSADIDLTGNFQNNTYFTDVNSEPYLLNISAAYDSTVNFSYLSIPLSILVHTNKKPNSWGAYIEAGVVASINFKSTYQVNGNFATSGYYEQYPAPMQTLDASELGFINDSNIDRSGDAALSPLHIALRSSVGITMPLNYFTTVFFGPEVYVSLNDIMKQSEYTDVFGGKTTPKSVGILNYGVKFGVKYKF